MTNEIIYETHYRGYELNKTKKRAKGFYKAPLDRLIDLTEAVYLSGVHDEPRAYHYVLDDPDMGKMKGFSNFLVRQAAKVAKDRGKPSEPIFYIVAYEKRHKKGGEHAHIYVFVDGWGWYETESLGRNLKKSGFSKKVSVQKRKIQSRIIKHLVDAETGEVLYEAPVGHYSRFHDLRTEMQDFLERASYIAKVMTKKEGGRKYSSSHLPIKGASNRAGSVIPLRTPGSEAGLDVSPSVLSAENGWRALEGKRSMGLSDFGRFKNTPTSWRKTGS